jgi:hypothetical protein
LSTMSWRSLAVASSPVRSTAQLAMSPAPTKAGSSVLSYLGRIRAPRSPKPPPRGALPAPDPPEPKSSRASWTSWQHPMPRLTQLLRLGPNSVRVSPRLSTVHHNKMVSAVLRKALWACIRWVQVHVRSVHLEVYLVFALRQGRQRDPQPIGDRLVLTSLYSAAFGEDIVLREDHPEEI